jgi:alpha-1,3-rhamnosyltransferase
MNFSSQNPLVTVIFITYNQDCFLNKAVSSIINQTYKNLEIILCNNGSTDNTKSLLLEYKKYKNIKVVNFDNNQKYTKIQGKLIDESNGEYICFIAGDDYYISNYIEVNIKAFNKLDDSYGFIHSPYYVERYGSNTRYKEEIYSKSGSITEGLIKSQITYKYVNCFTPFFRSRLIKKIKPDASVFFEAESYVLRLSLYTKIKYIGTPMYVMIEHDTNMGKNYKQNFDLFMKANLNFIALNPMLIRIVYSAIYSMCIRNAWISIRLMNDFKWAIECLEISKNYSKYSNTTNRERLIKVLLRTNKNFVFLFNYVLNLRYKLFKANVRNISYIDQKYND